jgi:hypothetical protein
LTVMIVVADADALQRATGALAYLSAKKHLVHVGVEADPPGAANLRAFHSRYPGLSVSTLPDLADEWRPFASVVRGQLDRRRSTATDSRVETSLRALERVIPPPAAVRAELEARKPDLLIVTRLRGAGASHVDYLRAARALGIRTMFLALAADDMELGSVRQATPDCAAVWNRWQRQAAVAAGVPARRTAVIGAHLATDILIEREVPAREEWLAALPVDASRRVVLLAVPVMGAAHALAAASAWNAERVAHSDPAVRDCAVVILARGRRDAAALGTAALPGVAAVVHSDERYAAAKWLHRALAHADAVVSLDDAGVALEAMARERPLLAYSLDPQGELKDLCYRLHRDAAWPPVASTPAEQIRQLADVLAGAIDTPGSAAAQAFVRVHGNDPEPGFLLASRLLRAVTPLATTDRSPTASVRTARWLAAVARWLAPEHGRLEHAADGKVRYLVLVPSLEALERWSSLLHSLVNRGHRVTALLATAPGAPVEVPPARSIGWGVRVAGAFRSVDGVRWRIGRDISAIALWLALLETPESPDFVRWRRRLDTVTLPPWASSLGMLARRRTARRWACQLAATLDRNFAASRAARRLLQRERPHAVVAFPPADAAVVDGLAAQAEIVRAARALGVPVVAGIAGLDGVMSETLAAGALRPHGLTTSASDEVAGQLETWQSVAAPRNGGGAGRQLRALAAGGALTVVIAGAAVLRGVSSTRSLARALMRRHAARGTMDANTVSKDR